MRRPLVVLPLLVSAVFVCAGCGGQAGGPTSGTGSLPVGQPCALLRGGNLFVLNPTAPPSQHLGATPSCSFDTVEYSVTIGMHANAGLAQVAATGPESDLIIGTHQAKQVKNSKDPGSCLVAIGVSTSSRVDVQLESLVGGTSCAETLSVARLIEPNLP